MKKYAMTFALLLFLTYTGVSGQSFCKNSGYIFSQSVTYHDPASEWCAVNFKIHIEEPRTESLDRYSVVALNQRTGSFSLDRNHEQHISSHLVGPDGQTSIPWDGKTEIPQAYKEKYRLDPKTNYGFKRFYQLMYWATYVVAAGVYKT